MIQYGFERQYQAASIEVSTIMLLEVSYGWSIESCGAVFTVVSSTSLFFAAISAMLMSRKLLSESVVFAGSNLISLVGVIFLFDFGTGAAGLLFAAWRLVTNMFSFYFLPANSENSPTCPRKPFQTGQKWRWRRPTASCTAVPACPMASRRAGDRRLQYLTQTSARTYLARTGFLCFFRNYYFLVGRDTKRKPSSHFRDRLFEKRPAS